MDEALVIPPPSFFSPLHPLTELWYFVLFGYVVPACVAKKITIITACLDMLKLWWQRAVVEDIKGQWLKGGAWENCNPSLTKHWGEMEHPNLADFEEEQTFLWFVASFLSQNKVEQILTWISASSKLIFSSTSGMPCHYFNEKGDDIVV